MKNRDGRAGAWPGFTCRWLRQHSSFIFYSGIPDFTKTNEGVLFCTSRHCSEWNTFITLPFLELVPLSEHNNKVLQKKLTHNAIKVHTPSDNLSDVADRNKYFWHKIPFIFIPRPLKIYLQHWHKVSHTNKFCALHVKNVSKAGISRKTHLPKTVPPFL